MTLVDTSVWVEFFKKKNPLDLVAYVPLNEVVLCLPVLQEVLQGFRDESAYRLAKEALEAFPCAESPLPAERFYEAVELYRTARKAGLTIRSPIDCVIAACAIRHNLRVLHADRDYQALAQVSRLHHRDITTGRQS